MNSKLEKIGKIIKKYFSDDYIALCFIIGFEIKKVNVVRQISNQIGMLRDGFPEFAIKGISIDQAKKDLKYVEKNWPDEKAVEELKNFWESI